MDVEPVELRRERSALLPLEAGAAVVRWGGASAIERGKLAAAQREVGAGVEGAALRPLVAAILRRTLVEQFMLAEPAESAITNAADDAIEQGLWVTNDSRANPYLCRIDPQDPLTNPTHLANIKRLVERHRLAPPEVSTPAQAAAVLRVLRAGLGAVVGGHAIQANLPALRREIAFLRGLAGERGPDPVLGKLLRGGVSPLPLPA